MVRGLILVAALAATAVQAQDVSKAAKGTDSAVPQEGEQRSSTPASRAAPGRAGSLSRSVASRDAGVDAGSMMGQGTSGKPADCSVVETLLRGDVPAVRTYSPPPPERTPKWTNAWKQAPYVAAATRCGRLYILQIWSQSKDEWVVAQASVNGPNGEALAVNAFRFNKVKRDRWNINVIVAEVPTETKLATLMLNLTGEDGRVAQPEARNLP